MKYLYYPFIVLMLVLVVVELVPIVVWAVPNYKTYQWVLYGMLAYLVLRKLRPFSRNEEWLQTTSHEMTHAFVGMLFLHKIHSLEVTHDGEGSVYHSGGSFGSMFISLSPYCFPMLTYVMLLIRIVGAKEFFYVFDILIGLSLAFHIVCFFKQTGSYQPDIKKQGYVRSYLFLVTAWLFNASVILLDVRMGFVATIKHLFVGYWHDLVVGWNATEAFAIKMWGLAEGYIVALMQ